MSSVGIAYRYSMLGKAVFPLSPNSKLPLIAKKDGGRGVHDATTDKDQIEAWWARCPTANVGMATGPISGCWVLDVDPHTSEDGAKWLADREAEFGALPPTPESRTLKGGRHLLFRWNEAYPVGNRVGFVKGLDARGDGGYIVAPPSAVHERKHGVEWRGKYEWVAGHKLSELEIAEAPQWLLDAVIHKQQSQVQPEFVPREIREGDGFRYGHKALDAECQAIMTAASGHQDNQIVSSAFKIGQLVSGGEIPRQDAEDALVNASMAIPGQSKALADIVNKVTRALDAGAQKPRRAPAKPDRGRPQLRVVASNEKVDPETGEVTDNYPAEEIIGRDWAMELNWSLSKDGNSLKPNSINNVRLMLTHHPLFFEKFALNRFSHKVWIIGGLPCDAGEPPVRLVQDHDYVSVAAWMNTVGLTPSWQMVGQVIGLISVRHTFDPVEEYLRKLEWDGKFRIKDWLTKYAGAEQTPYTDIVGPRFLISAVARVLKPGCKVDTMLVLEGAQGIKKSTLARAIFGSDWFSDQVGDVTSKESSIQIQGLWCIEVAEMDHFSRADDKAVKSFLTRLDDRYRPTYGLNTVEYPRRCVFIGTYNPDGNGILKDATGGRRYWYVTCGKIDTDAVMRDRDQLWAEAVENYEVGEQWWLEPHEDALAKVEQDARQESDMWDDQVREFLRERLAGMTFRAGEIAHHIGVSPKDRDQRVQARIGKILNRMGCEPARPYDEGGKQYRAWMKKPEDGK